jgi:hypothetical protein
MSDTPKLQEAADGGCPPATCSRLSALLPPAEIVEAAERVKAWMEVNGYQNWQLAGICDRRIAYQRDQMEAALMLAARWGISSDGYSAEVSSRIRCWIIGGMKGEAPKAPDYYPANTDSQTKS